MIGGFASRSTSPHDKIFWLNILRSKFILNWVGTSYIYYCYFHLNQILKVLLRIQNVYPDLRTHLYVEKDYKMPVVVFVNTIGKLTI